VVQRVKSASVSVGGEVVSKIGAGLCVLVGLNAEDTEEGLDWMAKKLLQMKFFGEEDKNWRQNVKGIGGEVLLVSQFTLYFRTKGSNLDFSKSMPPDAAREMYGKFVDKMKEEYGDPDKIKDGKFGAMMDVSLVNDGPVTMQVEWPEPPSQKK